MIPKAMESYLKERLPSRTWQNRLRRMDGKVYMEFGPTDLDRLSRLEIEVDSLGPMQVVCMWDEDSDLEIGGYLIIDNLAMGRPSMGGIRMLPDLIPSTVHNLARGMTLKNAAAGLPYGGGKSGIVAPRNIEPGQREEVIRGFARLLLEFKQVYLPGPDVGTNDADMKTIAIENGIDNALSKPSDMGGNRIDELGAAAGGVVIAIEALLEEMDRLVDLPQFSYLSLDPPQELSFIIQGFGAVGAHAAKILCERVPGAKIIGVSDREGYVYSCDGLSIQPLFEMWKDRGLVSREFFEREFKMEKAEENGCKFGTDPNDLLRESAFCLIPAAPVANYLGTDASTNPSMTVERMGNWNLIVEGANTYSPDPDRKQARAKMEREVYRKRGILIATDYLVNSGGVIYAAQERLIKTPEDLRFPEEILGNRDEVERWIHQHQDDLQQLAEKRRIAGEKYRDEIIKRNMHELTELLLSDADMLPFEAAERISIQRISKSESARTAADIMTPIPTIQVGGTVQQAAECLVQTESPILAVITSDQALAGVITRWDITRATAVGCAEDMPLNEIMTEKVISAKPDDGILTIVRNLEQYEFSALPVVDRGQVLGMVGTDILTRTSLLRLLQAQLNE